MNTGIGIELSEKAPSISGILSGTSKGLIWKDDEESPTIAVAYSYCVGGCGVAGRIGRNKAAARAFFERVFAGLRSEGINEFEFSSEDEQLYQEIFELFRDKEFKKEIEYSHRICKCKDIKKFVNEKKEDEELAAYVGQTDDCQYRIIEITVEMLTKINNDEVEEAGMLYDRMNNSWQSQEDFLAKSKAVAAIIGRKIIGIIFGSARYKNIIDVDIEVDEQYRRKGIALKLVNKFVELCTKEGIIVQWDCTESNPASRALVDKCGFTEFKHRPYYWFDI